MSDLTKQQLAAVLHQINPGPTHSPTAYLRFARVFTTLRNKEHMQQAVAMLREIRKDEPLDPLYGHREQLKRAINELDYTISRMPDKKLVEAH